MGVHGSCTGGFPGMAVVSGLRFVQVVAMAMNLMAMPEGRIDVRVNLDDRCARTRNGQDEEGEQCPS